MRKVAYGLALAFALMSGTLLVGQNPAPKPADPVKPADPPKADPKAKGQLPQNWKALGLTDKQTQDIYKIQAKYKEDIAKLDEQIKELKAKMTKEEMEILTADQKKRLEEILKGKAGTDK